MTVLPILEIDTNHSRYVIDQNSGTYTRQRVHPEANTLGWAGVPDAGEAVEYQEACCVASPSVYGSKPVAPFVGGYLFITHPDGTYVRSTQVVAVREREPA